ncbi:uncharacterized protein [Primulina huaijiensis]|uniref:uncharacterized protein n=1 Tax=Primulina huaijiensis TaxID=1492673 RepID=UPI003CC70D37
MSSGKRAWLVAASIGAVEALKDQGFCRWNYGMRVLQQHAKNSLRHYSATVNKSVPSMALNKMMTEERMKKSEESFRKVVYWSCWGPN